MGEWKNKYFYLFDCSFELSSPSRCIGEGEKPSAAADTVDVVYASYANADVIPPRRFHLKICTKKKTHFKEFVFLL